MFLNNTRQDLRSIRQMLGHLFSAILSGLRSSGYRIRIFSNDTQTEGQSSYRYRMLGCLSMEQSQLDADINKSQRLRNFTVLHTSINPQVNPIHIVFSSQLTFRIRKDM